ncbi:ATP-dependent nuclease [Xenophilus azovorans]|uniref:ATP-dependent nuclease n=1 Tax=Xenophilus azovorans TaxID=151755 RepID=UPI00056E2C65|nr:TOPRIM nucleotidyl transferase/hydrolase domain-containing protein [Xenophilus azovorans]
MKLTQIHLSNFQSFGPEATLIDMAAMTFLLGPNGTGKTAVLQALVRLFGIDPGLRRIRKTDFHVAAAAPAGGHAAATLWIEAQFEFAELKKPKGKHVAVPGHFAHMRLESADGVPRVRFRLTAQMDEDGDIEESMVYVLQANAEDEPTKTAVVSKHDRNAIQVHYLPARRDPSDHVSYAANSLLGRTLRAADWQAEREAVTQLTGAIGKALAGNAAIQGVGTKLTAHWGTLHKGAYYANPSLSFERSEIDNLLRHLTVSFTPGHAEPLVDFSRLSDGQQSLLYLSLVLSIQTIGREVLANKLPAFDIDKLRPAVFTLIAMEEPENSLSPHYLGRVIKALATFSEEHDSQAVVATHAPSLLRRVDPASIRYLRLDAERHTVVSKILMPAATDEAHKFVREAVQAFPELYFSRLVILGEGDSEEIVLPRLLQAHGLAADETSISVVPLGGRHVNHFWRLLHGLGIPQVTLLDLDLARHQGGWGRIKYALEQLLKFPTIESNLGAAHLAGLPKWNDANALLSSEHGPGWITFLESAGVFFSSPLDLDFLMIREFPKAYGIEKAELTASDATTIAAVLGKSHGDAAQYSAEEQTYFDAYHRRFKLGSKPAAHLDALAALSDFELEVEAPAVLDRLIKQVTDKLKGLPE